MLTEAQKKARKKGIGGSDAAAVCGVSKYRTPLSVYLDKVSEEEKEEVYNPIFERGHTLEPIIRKAFGIRMNRMVESSDETFFHPKYPYMLANIDGLIKENGKNKALVEIKTSNVWTKNFFMGDIPDDYFVQVQHYMHVMDVPLAYIAVLSGTEQYFDLLIRSNKNLEYFDAHGLYKAGAHLISEDIEIYDIPRDDAFIEKMIHIQKEFWENHVEKRIPPTVGNASDMKRMFPQSHKDKSVEVSDAMMASLELRNKTYSRYKENSKLVESFDKDIMEFMGDAEYLRDKEGNVLATWKNSVRKSLDLKKLKEESPQIYNKFEKEKSCRTLRYVLDS